MFEFFCLSVHQKKKKKKKRNSAHHSRSYLVALDSFAQCVRRIAQCTWFATAPTCMSFLLVSFLHQMAAETKVQHPPKREQAKCEQIQHAEPPTFRGKVKTVRSAAPKEQPVHTVAVAVFFLVEHFTGRDGNKLLAVGDDELNGLLLLRGRDIGRWRSHEWDNSAIQRFTDSGGAVIE